MQLPAASSPRTVRVPRPPRQMSTARPRSSGLCPGLTRAAGEQPSPVQDCRVGPLRVPPAGAFHRQPPGSSRHLKAKRGAGEQRGRRSDSARAPTPHGLRQTRASPGHGDKDCVHGPTKRSRSYRTARGASTARRSPRDVTMMHLFLRLPWLPALPALLTSPGQTPTLHSL